MTCNKSDTWRANLINKQIQQKSSVLSVEFCRRQFCGGLVITSLSIPSVFFSIRFQFTCKQYNKQHQEKLTLTKVMWEKPDLSEVCLCSTASAFAPVSHTLSQSSAFSPEEAHTTATNVLLMRFPAYHRNASSPATGKWLIAVQTVHYLEASRGSPVPPIIARGLGCWYGDCRGCSWQPDPDGYRIWGNGQTTAIEGRDGGPWRREGRGVK